MQILTQSAVPYGLRASAQSGLFAHRKNAKAPTPLARPGAYFSPLLPPQSKCDRVSSGVPLNFYPVSVTRFTVGQTRARC